MKEDSTEVNKLIEKMCNALRSEHNLLIAPNKQIWAVDKRGVICYALMHLKSRRITAQEIATSFNLRSHATVLYACNRIQNLLDSRDATISLLVDRLKAAENEFLPYKFNWNEREHRKALSKLRKNV